MQKLFKYPIIIANWKLNGSKEKLKTFFKKLQINLFLKEKKIKKTILLAIPNIYLDYSKKIISKLNLPVTLSAQNMDVHEEGAFTGETSPNMLIDIGINYTILGHSERRIHHSESNSLISRKFFLSIKKNIIPILCIGENKLEKKSNKTEQSLKIQLDCIFKNKEIYTKKNELKNTPIIIAYEPTWSIGSGISADPNEVQKISEFIKNYIYSLTKKEKNKIYVLYGGSIDEKNVKYFLKQPNIDGCLVGNASLSFKKFRKILISKNNKTP